MKINQIIFDKAVSICGTYLVGYFDMLSFPFEEIVARLYHLSGQDIFANSDGDKTMFEATGSYKGHVFALYDYKGYGRVHVGGTDSLDVDGLTEELTQLITGTEPIEFKAKSPYTGEKYEYKK